ncbi:MAG: SDR family NAD(P)-dependent oxidoreductase, partial [Thermoleophilia bacterium]|nr:SDR family NAD(P)-dependent oxidoreductase [Thermoleophilia bacterium]
MSGRLAGKVCLVTGSSGGLGNAFCRAMAREGAVVAAAGRDLARLEPLLAELPPVSVAGPAHMAVQLDTGDPESVAAGVRLVEETLGRVDVLENNAAAYGDLTRAPFWELPLDEWDRVMASNVRGPLLASRAVSAGMRARKCGRIINIASATFWSGSANWAHYVASKGALIGLTRVMAKELGSDDICVNVVAPGFTLTEASLSLIPGAETYGVDRGCVKRAQQPEDVVGLVV